MRLRCCWPILSEISARSITMSVRQTSSFVSLYHPLPCSQLVEHTCYGAWGVFSSNRKRAAQVPNLSTKASFFASFAGQAILFLGLELRAAERCQEKNLTVLAR